MHFLKNDPEPGSELSVKRRADDPAIHKLEHAGHFAHHSPTPYSGNPGSMPMMVTDCDMRKGGKRFPCSEWKHGSEAGDPYAPR